MICILLFFSFQLTEFSFPYSDNIVWSPHKCPGYRLPVSLSTCFWASCHNRATYMVPPGMPDMQPKANPFPDDGTMHTFPSGLFSEYCLPHFLSAWGKLFPFSDTMTICNIRMMFRTMPSFIFLDTPDSRFPTWVFHIPCARRKLPSWPVPPMAVLTLEV